MRISTHRSAARWAAAATAVLTVTSAVAACGMSTETADAVTVSATIAGSASNFSGRVTISGDRKMFIECRGTGSPTVVLIAGLQIAGDLWNSPLGKSPTVFTTLAKKTHVCLYDRPGTTQAIPGGGESLSDPVRQPTTTKDAVADLHALLAAAHQAGPYILLAHSYGGLIARLYASDYPRQVSGMVLLDVLSPEFRANLTAQQWGTWKIANATPAAAIKDYPALERVDFDPALNQVENARPIRQMPLAVLTADKPVDPTGFPPGIPASFAKVIDRTQHIAQSELVKLVNGAQWITNTHSGHNIMLDNPRLVSVSTERVIQAVRVGRHRLIG